MSNQEIIDKLRNVFSNMVVYKDPRRSKSIGALGIPGFLRDWLIRRFAHEDGSVDLSEVQNYVSEYIPRRQDWERLKKRMMQDYLPVKILVKIRAELDVKTGEGLFSLPDFGFPKKRYEAIIDKRLLKRKADELINSYENWGVVELEWRFYRIGKKETGVIYMTDFKAFKPYRVDLTYFQKASQEFTPTEWMDIILAAVDYNPAGFLDSNQKITFISRLLPFVEKRTNLIELAPKGTGKSYLFSQISKYGWLVSGGSITRAKLFYDQGRRSPGIITRYDYIALDEIQSITFPDEEEIRGALKGYLESGEFRVGDHREVAESGFILLGNIGQDYMNTSINMFQELPQVFHESALLDRFHGFIKGWCIPRMKENMKAKGWAINAEYFSEILHELRDDIRYRAIIDDRFKYSPDADTRDIEAIKRLATGFMKLIMPWAALTQDIDRNLLEKFCLKPALQMREIIRRQLHILDFKEYKIKLPKISLIDPEK